MSFNSSGTYTLYVTNPLVVGELISASKTNNTFSDIATALSSCILKDGTQTVTANIPMASHKFTGLSAGTTAGDSVEYGGSPSFTNLAYTGTLTGSTGILNIGSGQVYKDASGNVGIGTSSPNVKLAVVGDVTVGDGDVASYPTLTINGGSTSGNGSTIKGLASGTNEYLICSLRGIIGGGVLGLADYVYGANPRVFYTNGTERMRIDASGNVGIGTSSPASRLSLTVSGAGSVTALNLANDNAAFAAGTGPAINFGLSISSIVGTFGKIEVLNQTALIGADSYMAFSTRGGDVLAERMRIDASGNVGIGTSSPTGKLDVAGTIKTLGYTVATLPTGVVGARAYVTNALAPTYGATVVAGGAVVIPVFYNGTNWIVG